MHYLEQIAEGAWLKVILASLTYFFVEFLHGEPQVLLIYLGVSATDLFFGRKLAKKLNVYDPAKMKYWVRKQLTYLSLVLLAGVLCQATFLTSGFNMGAANWVLLVLTYVEVASIEDKFKALGYPVPLVLHKMFSAMRKKAVHDFSRLVDDPELRAELERALESKKALDIKGAADKV